MFLTQLRACPTDVLHTVQVSAKLRCMFLTQPRARQKDALSQDAFAKSVQLLMYIANGMQLERRSRRMQAR